MKFQRIYLPLTTFFCIRKLLQHRFTILQIFCFSFFVFFIQRPVQAQQQQRQPFAQGNLFVVFNPKTGRSSDQSPQLAYLNALWCQATQNGNDRLQIKEAHFVHFGHKEEHKHPARLDNAMKRAYLDLGQAQISEIGKYRCEITTEANQSISGNLFVYMRPLFNTTMRLVQAEEGNNFAWVAPLLKVTVGEQAKIECPAIGYPSPQIRWFKTGVPINTTATVSSSNQKKYLLGAQSLTIRAMEADDAGIYECKSTNSFPLNVDQDPREFHLSLMQELVVTKSHSWLIPLFVILICIILLVLIIWGCSAWKQYKRKQYNVAQKEKEFGQKGVDGQRLPLESEDVEE